MTSAKERKEALDALFSDAPPEKKEPEPLPEGIVDDNKVKTSPQHYVKVLEDVKLVDTSRKTRKLKFSRYKMIYLPDEKVYLGLEGKPYLIHEDLRSIEKDKKGNVIKESYVYELLAVIFRGKAVRADKSFMQLQPEFRKEALVLGNVERRVF